MKSKSVGNFLKNPPDGIGHSLKCIKSINWHHFDFKFFWDRQLCFYVKKLFVSEKTQKSELCHRFLHNSKVDGLKNFVQCVALFFWFDTFEGMSFFQQYFSAKGGGLGFWWLAFPIHFWSYFNAPHSFLASGLKKVKWFLAQGEL